MLLHKLYINVAITNNLPYRFTLKDLPEPKYKNLKCRFVEKRFLSFILVQMLLHMLLHKLFINVAIANIFLHAPALYDLRRLNYK